MNRIEKSMELKAPVSRVWKALTDHRQFGEWFGVKVEGPFEVGKISRGHITYPGYEYVQWDSLIEAMEPERRFVWSWHPYAVERDVDYSKEERTRVEFFLEKTATGTRLTVTESGFEKIPEDRRFTALRMNEGGWEEQIKNIETYVVPS